jgi:hypothetical protein
MSPVIARSTETPRPPGPPRPPEVPQPAPFPPPHVPIVPLPPPVSHMAVPQVPMRPPRWEYKRLTRPADTPHMEDAELNALGHDGWELVGVVATAQGTQYYFKRERA